jgi:hypothetical protein
MVSFVRGAPRAFTVDPALPLPGPAPYLSQVNGHPNESMNCVPTTLSMLVAKLNPAWAARAGGSGDRLIAAVSHAMRALDGSVGVNGLRSFRTLDVLARELGLSMRLSSGVNLDAMARELRKGRQVMLIGDVNAMPYADVATQMRALSDDAGHVIAVTAHDARTGAFLVNDPGHPAKKPVWMHGLDLAGFVLALGKNIDGTSVGSTLVVDSARYPRP